MPPSRIVETISWIIDMGAPKWPPNPQRWERPGEPVALLYRALFPLVPGAERDPLGAIGGELLRPHRDQRAVLPLEHVVLHARVRVLAGFVELHAPAVDRGADRQVERQHRGAELL